MLDELPDDVVVLTEDTIRAIALIGYQAGLVVGALCAAIVFGVLGWMARGHWDRRRGGRADMGTEPATPPAQQSVDWAAAYQETEARHDAFLSALLEMVPESSEPDPRDPEDVVLSWVEDLARRQATAPDSAGGTPEPLPLTA